MEKKLGRIFHENGDNEDLINDITSTRNLLEKLSNINNVLENASLIAAFMHYLYNKSHDYNPLLFYYVIRKYEKLSESKVTPKNYRYIHMEICTIFVDPKSILYIPIKNLELFEELMQSIYLSTYTTVFEKTEKYLIENIIEPLLEKYKTSISLGLEKFAFTQKIHTNLDNRVELLILESFHDILRNSLVRSQKTRCLPKQHDAKNIRNIKDFQIKAIFASLKSQYDYFIKSKTYSFLLRSPQFLTSGKMILSNISQFSMKKYKIKGHYFVESIPANIEICAVCNIILWGSSPQGLLCNNCKMSVHRECKEAIKPCQIKKGKSNFNSNEIMVNNHEKESEVLSKTDQSSGEEDDEIKEIKNIRKTENVVCSQISSVCQITNGEPITPTKFPYKPMKRLQDFYSPPFERSNKSSIKSTKSMNNNDYNVSEMSRHHRARTPSPERFLFYPMPFKRAPDKSKISISDNESNNSSNISVEPLIMDEWELDEEMKVNETFDPEIELQNFSNPQNISKSKDNSVYSRLLVLMEFHHKTKFIQMILKRFKYMVVDRWQRMGEFLDLFDLLSLNCIHDLYTLIKNLVETMDKSKNAETYDDQIAENVYKWLTDKDDANLHCWLRLSVDLCCTNILQSIKNNWMEHKRIYPKLNELLSVEFNRLIVIEQLANMKPLLFNLPMIVSKIIKDLKRFSEYQDEVSIWEKVYLKLIYLPRFIDERCMPVVDMINSGTIIGSSLRYENSNTESENENRFEKFITSFPKTIFKEHFIDFQLIIISNLRELHLDNSKIMQSTVVYIREEIEGAAICYANKMIILQKENDKYLLKKFKSINQKKLFPVVSFDKVHVTKQTVKEVKHHSFELTILLIDQAVLIQILFKEEKIRNMWFDHIIKNTKKTITHHESTVSLNYSPLAFSIEDEKTANSVTKNSLRTNLEDASDNLKKALDVISERMSKDFAPQDNRTNNMLESEYARTKKSANEMFYDYFHIVFEYVRLGVQFVEENEQIEPHLFLKEDTFLSHFSRIKDLSMQMMHITDNNEQIPQSTELKIERSPKKTYNTIQEYVEDIISYAKEQLCLDSKTEGNCDSRFLHDNSKYKYD